MVANTYSISSSVFCRPTVKRRPPLVQAGPGPWLAGWRRAWGCRFCRRSRCWRQMPAMSRCISKSLPLRLAKGEAGVVGQPLGGVAGQDAVVGEGGQKAVDELVAQPSVVGELALQFVWLDQVKRLGGSHGKSDIDRAGDGRFPARPPSTKAQAQCPPARRGSRRLWGRKICGGPG
jgi:hypothetical protein